MFVVPDQHVLALGSQLSRGTGCSKLRHIVSQSRKARTEISKDATPRDDRGSLQHCVLGISSALSRRGKKAWRDGTRNGDSPS